MLPSLRQDLSLHAGPSALDGAPTWVLHDPAANRFYSLSWCGFEILSRWTLNDPLAVIAAVNSQTTLRIDAEDITAVVEFLMQFSLLDAQTAADSARLSRAADAGKLSAPQWLLKNYLFLRLPLWRPARLLARAAPYVRWVFTPPFWLFIFGAGVLGLCLASRQWNTFIGTFAQYKSFSGVLAIGVALSLAKLLHELGHALTAQRFGCRVPSMGVAFLVMLPVLYTDTNDAWKLADKQQRLAIAAAGMLAEVALGALAILLWNFLPDGAVRAGVFLLASTTWILTLGINASPFMRFDGYFLLCDWLDMPNLHTRAAAMGRWWLREMLFGWHDPRPEQFNPRRHAFLIGFAFATWIYRLGVFLGIAYLVYDSFFKLLGVLLLLVELTWFIALPIYKEVEVWWRRRADLEWNAATVRSSAFVTLLMAVLVLPWQHDVRAPAVLGAAQSQSLYAVAAAQVIAAPVVAGTAVKTGDVLLRLDSPDLAHQLAIAETHVRNLRSQLDRQPFDPKLLQEGAALHERWVAAVVDVAGLSAQVEQLVVRAPFDGRATDINEGLAPGSWVAVHERLLQVIGSNEGKGEALVREADLSLLRHRDAVFVAESADQRRILCRLGAIDRVNLTVLDAPYLSSTYGGAVRVQTDAAGVMTPLEALFRARLVDCGTSGLPLQEMRGTAHLVSKSTSLAGRLWRWAITGMQREMAR